MPIWPTGFNDVPTVVGADKVLTDDGTVNGWHTVTEIAAYLATLTQTLTNKTVQAIGAVTSSSPTAGVGYATGAGGVVTQSTSKSTGVTRNTTSGQITMNGAAVLGSTTVGFTFTNSTIAATDTVLVTIASGASADSYHLQVDATAAGSCRISLRNVTAATALSEALVLNYNLFKGVAA